MSNLIDYVDSSGMELQERTVGLWRCAAVVKGGRRFSFASMVVVGDGKGHVGAGYGKAKEVPTAIEKATADARKNMISVPLDGDTIPHEVYGSFGAARVVLVPASPGTGTIAGAAPLAVLECLGVKDILSKSIGGSNNKKNLVKATMNALSKLRSKEVIESLRNVKITFHSKSQTATAPKDAAPEVDNTPEAGGESK